MLSKQREREIRSVYKRLERDDEYRARLKMAGCYLYGDESSAWLDKIGDQLRPPVQRKIVEDVAY